jgi:hypothetical protein
MAALTVADTGLGASITGSGLITAQIKSIGEMTISVDTLDISHLGVTGFELLRPSDLRKNPEVDIVHNWLGAAPPITIAMIPSVEPYAGIAVTITYPLAGSFQGTAFVKEVKTPKIGKGEVMTGSYKLQFDGAAASQLTFTPA